MTVAARLPTLNPILKCLVKLREKPGKFRSLPGGSHHFQSIVNIRSHLFCLCTQDYCSFYHICHEINEANV